MPDSSVLLVGGAVVAALVLLCLALGTALRRSHARARRELEVARAESAELRHQIEEIERVLTAPPRTVPRALPEYTITGLGRPDVAPAPAPQVDRALFADLVLRETVVRAASLAHGVRRALAPEARNRVRFEVRREIKRARKQRRAETREARRDWEARQRARIDNDGNETAA